MSRQITYPYLDPTSTAILEAAIDMVQRKTPDGREYLLSSDHLLLALINANDPQVNSLVKASGNDPAAIARCLKGLLPQGTWRDISVSHSGKVVRIMHAAYEEAMRGSRREGVRPAHLFLAALSEDYGPMSEALPLFPLDYNALRETLRQLENDEREEAPYPTTLTRRLALPTALVVIDVQRDFCAPGGWRGLAGGDLSDMERMVDTVHTLIDSARSRKVPVVFIRQVYDPRKLTELQRAQFARGDRPIVCAKDTEGADLYRMAPLVMDAVFSKATYNAFDNPSFAQLLEEQGIQNLVLVGVDTQICVETTARSAFDRGYSVVVPVDGVCSNGTSRSRHHASLETIDAHFGAACESFEIIDAWERAS